MEMVAVPKDGCAESFRSS